MIKLDISNQIKLNEDVIKKLLSVYDVKYQSYKLIKFGIENISAFISTKEGKFVLRVYRNNNKKLSDIKLELEFMAFLRKNGVKTPKIIGNHHKQSLSRKKIDNKFWNYILMEFVDGAHLKYNQINLISSLAKAQAIIHKHTSKFKIISKDYHNFRNRLNSFVSEYKTNKPFIYNKYGEELTIETIEEVVHDLKKNLDALQKLPSGLVHLDYHGSNILVKDNKINGIIDFDDLSFSPFVADLANSLLWWTYLNQTKNIQKIKEKYLLEYQKYRKLSRNELALVALLMRWRNVSVGLNLENFKRMTKKDWQRITNFDLLLKNDIDFKD
ncbi:MAG: phosphotransferase [Patescibacteria group bacterium]